MHADSNASLRFFSSATETKETHATHRETIRGKLSSALNTHRARSEHMVQLHGILVRLIPALFQSAYMIYST
jgi:hypothetical protein